MHSLFGETESQEMHLDYRCAGQGQNCQSSRLLSFYIKSIGNASGKFVRELSWLEQAGCTSVGRLLLA